ncbi:hypothetical protein, partial [Legionella shakespearei]|uniref:hypothetical protein n=1 Tax=Legionella shakespearei TaxID=45075 RepID=UPI001ED9C1F7
TNARKPSRDRQEAEQLYWHAHYFLLWTFALVFLIKFLATSILVASRPGYDPLGDILIYYYFSIAYMFICDFDKNKPLNLKSYLGKMQTVLIFQ